MSIAIIEWLEKQIHTLKDATSIDEDIEQIGKEAVNYIKAHALQDLYSIGKVVLLSVASGTPWGEILAAVVKQGEAAGISIAKGAEAVVVAQAQADLIAAGHLPSPVTTPAA